MIDKFTQAQKDAVKAKGSVIVTAAAGSGKTAVLVERVIDRLRDMENPVSADRLLIVTFTNPAAAEMRHRIEKRLSDECEAHPENTYLLKQKLLISSADICTIDSFCIKLIRTNFSVLGINPDFKIADNAVAENIRRQVINKIFKNRFEEKKPEFFDFLHSTDSVYGDEKAIDFIFKLYDYSMTLPFPEKWLKNAGEQYCTENFLSSCWGEFAFKNLIATFNQYLSTVSSHIENIKMDTVLFEKAGPVLADFIKFLQKCVAMAEEKNWNGVRSYILNPPVAPVIRTKKCDQQLLSKTRGVFRTLSSSIKDFAYIFEASEEDIKNQLDFDGKIAEEMISICLEFSEEYFKALSERGYLTFSITEQLAYKLLCEVQNGEDAPSYISKELSKMYYEVMVDEYQDVNDLQNTLFEVLSDSGKHLFTVGDAKQSIYGFRGSNPENFIRRSNNAEFYSECLSPDTTKRIVLSNNFRSRAGVCDFINGFFSLIMSESFGGMRYDRHEKLYPLAEYPENGESCCEIHYIDGSTKQEQAEAVAEYILQTVNKAPFLKDKNTDGTLRSAEYGDFAVLLRAATGFETYVKAFNKKGIPVSIGNGDFFKTIEVKTVIAFLTAIHKPMNDNAMLAVLMSPVFGFTAEDVARFKATDRSKRFYTIINSEAGKGNNACADFLKRFLLYRQKAACMPIADFIRFFLEESDYINYVYSLPEAESRTNNLFFLEELASAYASDFSGDLGSFLNYLRYLEDQGELKSKTVVGENSVKITTMHKSKGLQYPITVIAETNATFSSKDLSAPITVNDKMGIAFNRVDDEENLTFVPACKRITNMYLSRKQREEELRLIYVAMTRAEEKLVIFINNKANNHIEKVAENLLCSMDSDKGLSPQMTVGCSNFAEWITSYALTLESMRDIRCDFGFMDDCIPEFLKEYSNSADIVFHSSENFENTPIEITSAEEPVADIKTTEKIRDIFSYEYPFSALKDIEAKTSVSKLAKKNADREFCATARPAFLATAGLSPTERGTALHKFMQYADFKNAEKNIKGEIERLCENGFISKAEADVVKPEQIQAFVDTSVFKRLNSSDKILREQRFLLEVPAGELYDGLDKNVKGRMVVIQGAVDCMFFENGKIVIIDFKTDRTNCEDFLLKCYSEQLRIYSVAASKMFKMPVEECYIYSLNMSKWIRVNL